MHQSPGHPDLLGKAEEQTVGIHPQHPLKASLNNGKSFSQEITALS
jgi:hypothetical protein